MQAYDAYQEIRHCIAFNVPGQHKRKKINQHATAYTFEDGTILRIHTGKSYATVTDANGFIVVVGKILVNK